MSLSLAQSLADARSIVIGAGTLSGIMLTRGLTKSIAAPWVAGNGGGLDTGTAQAGVDYHAHLILNDGVADVVISRSPYNPALPPGWSYWGWIGAFITQAAAPTIEPFVRTGSTMWLIEPRSVAWNLPMVAPYYPNTGRLALPVPRGIATRADVSILAQASSGNPWVAAWGGDLGLKSGTVNDNDLPLRQYIPGGGQSGFSCQVDTDTGGHIYWRHTAGASGFLWLNGWEELRRPEDDETARPVYVCCAGTSLTDPAGRWQPKLQTRLRAVAGRPVVVQALGEGGKASDYWLSNVALITAQRPDILLLETSMNDANFSIGVPQAEANVRGIIAAVKAAMPGISIFLMTMNWCGRINSNLNAPLVSYYADYRAIAADPSVGVGLIDNAVLWPTTMPDSYFQETLVSMPGGIHTTPEMNDTVMNPNIVTALEPLVG